MSSETETNNTVKNLSISLIEDLSKSVERKQHHAMNRKKELISAKQQVSTQLVQDPKEPVLVHLGENYYAKYPPKKALESIDRMLYSANKFIAQCDIQLDSASRAISDLDRILEDSASTSSPTTGKKDKPRQAIDALRDGSIISEIENDPFMTDDGLPIMEIVEELDDDGNITCKYINIKI